MVFDHSCRHDLVRSNGHAYFIDFMRNESARPGHKAMAAFVLATVCTDFDHGQASCFQSGLLDVLVPLLAEPHALLRWWSALCLARLWSNNPEALAKGASAECGIRANTAQLLTDSVAEVRAAAVLACLLYTSPSPRDS